MKKFYAVKYKNGSTDIFHTTWDEASKHILGKKGVLFKSFDMRDKALDWLGIDTIHQRYKYTLLEKDKYYIFVDGSYSSSRRYAGWGWVCVKNDEIISEDYGVIKDVIEYRNILGELTATMEAVKWAGENLTEFLIVHDYAGIGCWAVGYWKTNKELTRNYKKFMKDYMKKCDIKFEKVSGHSDIKWNDYADELTRKGY